MYITPCVSICTIKDGVCVGCGRTRKEIASWRRYSDKQRLDVMKRLGYGTRKDKIQNDS